MSIVENVSLSSLLMQIILSSFHLVFDEFDTIHSGKCGSSCYGNITFLLGFLAQTPSQWLIPISIEFKGTITLAEFKAALMRFNYSDVEIEAIFRKVVSNAFSFSIRWTRSGIPVAW